MSPGRKQIGCGLDNNEEYGLSTFFFPDQFHVDRMPVIRSQLVAAVKDSRGLLLKRHCPIGMCMGVRSSACFGV